MLRPKQNAPPQTVRTVPTFTNSFVANGKQYALRYLIEGKPYPGGEYKLHQPSGYPSFKGAMFWAINEDRRNNYQMSNAIGPLLHSLPK
jgi:hypothetical protein